MGGTGNGARGERWAGFFGEGEVAFSMTEYTLENLSATPEQIDRESERIRRELS